MIGTKVDTRIPTEIESHESDIVDVKIGSEMTLILRSNGMVYGIGSNSDGRLGDGTTSQRNRLNPISFINSNITKISGRDATFAVLREKKAYSFGKNEVQLYLNLLLVWSIMCWFK
jgi:alpha-tubulin suppressor-like RCC1 family protein